ncbi:MAG: efflux RND transporter periplasmic adaptor subunit [Gemmatimonadaceae bacterium]
MIDGTVNPFGSPRSYSGRIYAGIGIAVLLAAALIAWLATRKPEPAAAAAGQQTADTGASKAMPVTLSAEQSRRIGVTYALVTLAPLNREIRTVGLVTFDETRVKSVSPKVEGWIEHLLVNYTGQFVGRGQALLTIYSPMLVTAQEELLLAKRLRNDVREGSSDARKSADDLIESARRRLSYWDISASEISAIESSGQVRKTLTLRSPFGGYVLEKNVLEGQRVMMGDALYKVADLSSVWVEGEVFEQDLRSVRLGQQVTVEFEALAGEILGGRITYIYPTVNPETRTAKVRVALVNTGMRLKPGMYATLRTSTSVAVATLGVPRSAVLQTGERSLVFVKAGNGQLQPREVKVGSATEDRIEILSGLRAGETVVASATFLVDAESNLGSLLGGMGNMPGMDIGSGKATKSSAAPSVPTR